MNNSKILKILKAYTPLDLFEIHADNECIANGRCTRYVTTSEHAHDLGLDISQKLFIIKQVKDGQEEDLKRVAKEYGLDLVGTIPDDKMIRDFDLKGKPTIELEKSSAAVIKASGIFEKILAESL